MSIYIVFYIQIDHFKKLIDIIDTKTVFCAIVTSTKINDKKKQNIKKERRKQTMSFNKQTAIQNRTVNPLYIGVEEVMMIYSISRTTAEKVGKISGARIKVGRRVLYNVDRLKNYFESLQSENA